MTLSFWLPPPEAPRRFATWFFLAPAADQPSGGRRRATRSTSTGGRHRRRPWRRATRGEIELVPPTFTTLWWLAHRRDVARRSPTVGGRPPERFLTRMASGTDGVRATLWDGDAGYGDGDLDRPGPRRRLWIDPGRWRVEITAESGSPEASGQGRHPAVVGTRRP